ncbi:MAG: Adenosine deaminase [Frankiales bacterium]|nr:Adenosine deaminase [Frankiales bacterium]
MRLNLHTHLEGRLRPATAAELALDLPDLGPSSPAAGDLRAWARALQLDGPADLTVYLQKVAASYPFFGSEEGLHRISSEAVQDAAADGLDYLELRFGPANHVRPGRDLDAVTRAVCEGVAEGMRLSGMPAGVVVAALRDHDVETNLQVARVAARHAGNGVVGFDLAGDELRFPELEPHAGAYAIARAAGLGLTCHAAEAAPGRFARQAAELLGVTRIGHGAHVATDPEALRWAADSGVVIEVCPTSNWFTGAIQRLEQHPVRRFHAAGVRLALGDDNPIQTQSPYSAERSLLSAVFGFDDAELAELDATSLSAAFMPDSTRAALSARLPLS